MAHQSIRIFSLLGRGATAAAAICLLTVTAWAQNGGGSIGGTVGAGGSGYSSAPGGYGGALLPGTAGGGSGYGAPSAGYGAPGSYGPAGAGGYGAPSGSSGYGAPAGYGAPPAAGYGTPGGYGMPSAGYGSPGGYGVPTGGAPGGYGAPATGYGAPGGYGAPTAGYGTSGGYGAPAAGYGVPGGYGAPGSGVPGSYGVPPAGYGGSVAGYGAPPGGYGMAGAPPMGYGAPGYANGAPMGSNGYTLPSSGYGQTMPSVPGGYLGTQSFTSLRAAACAQNPRFCSSAPSNGYLGSPGYSGPAGLGAAGYSGSASANPSSSQMPSLMGPPAPSSFSTSAGFPSPGGLSLPAQGGGSSGNSGGGLSNLLSGVDQNTLNTVAAQLGVSGDQLNSLRNQVASGSLGADQLQNLSARFGSLNMSSSQIGAIANTLGLNASQVGAIQQTLASTRGAMQPGMSGGPPPPGMSPGMPPSGMMQQSSGGFNYMPSQIEADFQAIDNPYYLPQPPTSSNLTQFGYNFFSNPATASTALAQVQNMPVGNDYLVGPGDEIDILLWGRDGFNTVLNPTVDRNGMIQVTEIGPLQVAGLTFAQAKKLIEDKAKKMTGVQVDVTMGQLRTINITVAGDVMQPGSYQISALSRLSNALVAAGGVSKVGSLRHIEVRHDNQLTDVVDLYDILLHGDNSADARLQEGDVIFVPVIGNVVGVAGEVKRPAIYELKKDHVETLDETLKLAGGVSGFGFGDRVQVERIQGHKRMLALDIPLKQLSNQRFTILDGDVIKIYPVLPGRVNTVVLSGNVRRPGEFQWYKGMRVSDLVKRGEGILPNTYFKYALIRRLTGPEKSIHFLQVNLGDALTSPHMAQGDVALSPKDELDIYNLDDIRDLPAVAANGEVRFPGIFVLSPDMKISDLVYMAGGLKDDAYQDRVVLVRSDVTPNGRAIRRHIDINLRAILKGDFSEDLNLQSNDELFIRSIQDWQRPLQFVEISGEVRLPGVYDYYPGMRVSDLLAMAQGPADDAYLKRAELARTEVINGTQTGHTYMDIDLRTRGQGNDKNVLLRPNDELLVKAASNYHLPFTVMVSGKVMRPGIYTIREGERLNSILERCGGFLPDAFVQGIVFKRVSVQMMQQQALNEARQRLQNEAANVALTQASLVTAGGNSSSSSGAGGMSMMLLQGVLASSQNQQADGRIVIHISSLQAGKQGPDNLVLEDGDSITVPVLPSSVSVIGEVNHPTSFLWVGSNTVRDYINQAGGVTQYADKKQIMVIKADGSVLTTQGFDGSRKSEIFPALPLISGGLMTARLDVGDTVFVPEDLTSFQDVQTAKDVTQIIANAATGLATVGLLAATVITR